MTNISRRSLIKGITNSILLQTIPTQFVLASEQVLGFKSWQTQFDAEFDRYKKQYGIALKQFKGSLQPEWGENPDIKSRSTWVDYQNGVRRRLDFDKDQADVTVIQDPGETIEQAAARAKAEMNALFVSRRQEFIKRDPVESQLGTTFYRPPEKQVASPQDRPFEHIKPTPDEISSASVEVIQLPTGKPAVRIAVPVRNSLIKKRAPFLSDIRKRSRQYQVHESLISAVIQAESYFNPMATSHVPAYGLMQIVPHSAGQDIIQYLYKRRFMPTPDWLYNAENNILAGSTYLFLLSNRYLHGINNAISLQYCAVAAYNTGPGNLARAFSGSRKIGAAINEINKMAPEQVFDHLRRHLPYKETQEYIVKVNRFQRSWMHAKT